MVKYFVSLGYLNQDGLFETFGTPSYYIMMNKIQNAAIISLLFLTAFCSPLNDIAQRSRYTEPIQKDVWIGMDMVDGGTTWIKSGKDEMVSINEIKADPSNPGWICVACTGRGLGLYLSNDQGITWQKRIQRTGI